MRKIVISLFALLFAVSMISACSSPAQKYNIATATTGGAFYPAGAALAQLFSENMEEAQFSSSSSAGSVENISLFQSGEAQAAFIQNDVLFDAYTGTGNYADEGAYTDLRIISPIATTVHHLVVRTAAKIDNVQDLKGKKVNLGRPGSGAATTAEALLNTFGITTEDITVETLGSAEAADALRNGQIDAAYIDGGVGNSTVTELLISVGDQVQLLTFTEEELQLLESTNNWVVRVQIPADAYPSYEQPFVVTGHLAYLATTDKAISEDTVYQMLTLMFDNQDKLIQGQKWFDNPAFTESEKYLDYEVPLHDGAEKYFIDKGLLSK